MKTTIIKLIEQHIPGNLRTNQKDWISQFLSPDKQDKFVLLTGERQSGRTSIGVGMLVSTLLLRPETRCISLSKTHKVNEHQEIAIKLIDNFAQEFNLPNLITRKNRHEVELANGSKIFFSHVSSTSVRGMSVEAIFLDANAPTLDNISMDLMNSIIPSIYGSRGKLIISLGD